MAEGPPGAPPGAPPPPPQHPTGNVLLDTLAPLYTTRMYGTALYTLLLWEFIITFKDEYRFIWKAQWSVVKCAFLFCRYWTLIVQAFGLALWDGNWSTDACRPMFRVGPALGALTISIGSFILLIRCYAIYQKSPWILYPGLVGQLAVIGCQYWAVASAEQLIFPPDIPRFACVATGESGGTRSLLAMFAGPMCFDFVITILTTWKVVSYYRSGADTPLLVMFWRDGLLYFVLICTVNLINVAFLVQDNQIIQPVNVLLAHIMTPIFAQRLVLRLRVSGMQSQSVGAYSHRSDRTDKTPKYPPNYSSGYGDLHSNGTDTYGGTTGFGELSTISPPASTKFGYNGPPVGSNRIDPTQPPPTLPPFSGQQHMYGAQSNSFKSSGGGYSHNSPGGYGSNSANSYTYGRGSGHSARSHGDVEKYAQ